MKLDTVVYVAQCRTCQQVKVEHQKPVRLLHQLDVPKWKWDHIVMDFVVELPKISHGHNVIWVVVDRLTKSAHFIPYKVTDSIPKMAELYLREIVWLHGIPASIVFDRVHRFTS
ncbi:hypothetical protein SLA2020_266810 [Shorea laevis]